MKRAVAIALLIELHTTPGWGTIKVPQWDVEPTDQTLAGVTYLDTNYS